MSTKQSPIKRSNLSVLERMKQQQPILSAEVSDDITVGDFARYWLKHLKTDVKDSTRYSYESAISTHICRVFENMKLSAVTAEDVQLFIMSLSDGMDLEDPLSPKTIRNIHGVFHKIMQDAFEMKLIAENPAKHTRLPKKQTPELVPMNTNQVHDFLGAIVDSPLEVFYKLALFTGMRKAELIGLTWDCFQFEEGSVRVYRQLVYERKKRNYYFSSVKNGKPRTIYPAPDIMKMMKCLWEKSPNSKFVFRGLTGGDHLTPSQIQKSFEALRNSLGMEEFRFHDLRHTYAVLCIKAGVDLKTLSETMGHYSVSFTLDTYAFALNDMKEECANRMQTYMKQQNFTI